MANFKKGFYIYNHQEDKFEYIDLKQESYIPTSSLLSITSPDTQVLYVLTQQENKYAPGIYYPVIDTSVTPEQIIWEKAYRINEWLLVSTFDGVIPDENILYILSQDITLSGQQYKKGFYTWDSVDGYVARSSVAEVDDITIDKDANGKLEIKLEGVETKHIKPIALAKSTDDVRDYATSVDTKLTTEKFLQKALQTIETPVNDKDAVNKKYVDVLAGKIMQFRGFISSTAPTGTIADGSLWYEGSALPTTFPINVKIYANNAWSTETIEYTPSSLDLWSNLVNDNGYYWFGNKWNLIDEAVLTDNTTIDKNLNGELEVINHCIGPDKLATNITDNDNLEQDASNKIIIKNGGVKKAKLNVDVVDDATLELDATNGLRFKIKTANDATKVWRVQPNGTWSLENINEWLLIANLNNILTPNDHTLYILTADCTISGVGYKKGSYTWNSTNGYILQSRVAKVFVDTDDLSSIINPDKEFIYRIAERSYKHNSDKLQLLTCYKILNVNWNAGSSGIIAGSGYKLNGSDYNITEEHDLKAYKINNTSQIQANSSGITIGGNTYSYGSISTQLTNELFNASSMGYVSSVSAYEDPDTFNEWFNNGEISFIITVIDYDDHSSYYKDSLTKSVISYNDITTDIINNWINNNDIEENNFNESDFFYYEVDSTNKGFDYKTAFSSENDYKLYHNPTEQVGASNFVKIGVNLDNYYDKTEIDNKLDNKQNTLTTEQLSAVNSGINTAKVDQIETNKNDIINLKAKKFIIDVDFLPAAGDPYVFYRISTNAGWKVNNSGYNISEEHDLRLYKILDSSQVTVSDSGITISGTNYSYGSVDSALQNSLMNATISGYISYVMISEDESAAINMYNNNEIGFYISYIDYELTTLYNVNTLNYTNAETKLYQWINGHYIQIDDYTEIYNEINNKQDKLTNENGTVIEDLDIISDVDLTTNKVIKRTFTQVWNWIISKLSTIITSGSTDAQIPSAKAVYNLFDSIHLYQHIFGIKYANVTSFYGMLYIFTTNNTPFTYGTLAKWLFDNGFTGGDTQYPICSGSDDFVTRYASSISEGKNDKLFTATGPMIGLCSTDGSTIKYYYNRTSNRTLSATQGSGTWIQNVSILRIL